MVHNSITGKELITRTLKHEDVPRVPWVPYAGVHAAKFKGYTAVEILHDSNKLFESLIAVNEIYLPDGQPVVFDLQLEAEILGCDLYWVDNSPPSVASHPLSEIEEIPQKMPIITDGRLPVVLDVMKRMKKEVGAETALYGLVTGPLTLASHLRGTDIFMNMIRNPDYVKNLLSYTQDFLKGIIQFYIEAGMDVIALVDPLVSQISSKHFNIFLTEPYSELFSFIKQKDSFSSFFVCGDATKNIEVMCQTSPDSIAVDENVGMINAKEIMDKYNITLSGNIPLTTKMLLGNQKDNMKFVIEFLDSIDHHNLILAPGCDMPFDTPIENGVGCMQAVRNPAETRKMLENYEQKEIDLDSVDLPNYEKLSKPLIELFTLDSSACAACFYMLKATLDATTEIIDEINVVEYKFTKPENVARVMKMGVKNLPSLYINGELKFSSIIPEQDTLMNEIKKYL
jgi:uroporphyrinogen decarboxylase